MRGCLAIMEPGESYDKATVGMLLDDLDAAYALIRELRKLAWFYACPNIKEMDWNAETQRLCGD
jgi:hypothetical protein